MTTFLKLTKNRHLQPTLHSALVRIFVETNSTDSAIVLRHELPTSFRSPIPVGCTDNNGEIHFRCTYRRPQVKFRTKN